MDRRASQLNRTKNSTYQLKTYSSFVYGWSPEKPDYAKEQKTCVFEGVKKFCNAVPFSQGQDWFVTYVYNIEVSGEIPKRIAYVACDYVE